jgi:uncharacterized protein YjlB
MKIDGEIKTFNFKDDGRIPNNPTLPMLVYKGSLPAGKRSPDACRALFDDHNWRNSWVNGVFNFHHYHSNTHEVLGVVSGTATLALGGPEGIELEVVAGDVLVIPAGTGHCNKGSSADFQVVGAYPDGMSWDLCRGKPGERPEKVNNIRRVPVPEQDPVFGKEGPLVERWGA